MRRSWRIDLDDAFDWKRVAVVTAADIPGANVVSLIHDDQPILVPVGGEIRHQAEPCASSRRPIVRRSAWRNATSASDRAAAGQSSTRWRVDHEFAEYNVGRGDLEAAWPRPSS